MPEKKVTPKRTRAQSDAERKAASKIRRIKRIKRSGDDGRIALNHNESTL